MVEADETYIGGKETNKHECRKLKAGRGTIGKTAVIGFRERSGQTKAKVLTSVKKGAIRAAVRGIVASQATLHTDTSRFSWHGRIRTFFSQP
nr:transposase [Pseudodesulfovibrio sp. JC047]